MRKLTFLVLFVATIGFAQNKHVLYNFAGLPQTLLLNPGAEVENKFYFGFPLFSQVDFRGGFSGFSAYDIIADDGVDVNLKIRDAIQNFGRAEFINLTQQLEVLSGGFKLNESSYLSFGYYQELDVLVKIPKDLIELFYDGNVLNRSYNFNKLAARADLLGVLHAGISKKLNDKWHIGGRFKIYSGVLNAYNKGNRGSFYTTQGVSNIYGHHLEGINVLMQTSGIIFDDNDEVEPSYFTNKFLFGGNLGIGLDLGFTYNLDKQWQITGSLQDIGFISNSKNVESYKIKGDYFTEGIELLFDEDNPEDYWETITEDFENSIPLDTLNSSYITTRPLKLNGSVQYSFGKKLDDCRFEMYPGKYMNKTGLQLHSVVGSVHSYLSATLFFERWFSKHFQAKVTYTADPYSFYNLGAGISTQFGAFNLYMVADNLLNLNNLYNAKSASFQLGVNFIFYDKY